MRKNKWYNFLITIVFSIEKKPYSICSFGQEKFEYRRDIWLAVGCWQQRLARPTSCSPSPGMQPFCKITTTTKFIFWWFRIISQDNQDSSMHTTAPAYHHNCFFCKSRYILISNIFKSCMVQVNLCQKYLFSYQLTHNMTKYCSLIYQSRTRKLQAQSMLCT